MYPVSFRGASTSFFILVALASAPLTGCSSGPANPPVSVPLNPPEAREVQCEKQRSLHGPNIYQCQSELGPMFVTTVKDCSIPEKFTFQATTRQLLVGVMDLTVISQEPQTLNSVKTLHSIVHGTMDVDPFIMSIYTFHQNECITDLVVWRGSSHGKPSADDTAKFSEVSSSIAKNLVATLIPTQEQPRAES
jgi:hypothetical protein